MEPTNLIYNAWRNTEKPLVYQTTDGKGNRLENQVDFVDPEKHPSYDADYNGRCSLCGELTEGGIPCKKMFGSKYMDYGIHKYPENTHICKSCAFCLLLNVAQKRNCLKKYSFVADEKLHLCNRSEMREYIVNPPKPPFVMVCAVSQKKHLATKARCSYSRDKYFCNLEERTVPVDNKEIKQTIRTIEALRGIGITKTEIESGKLSSSRFSKLGFSFCEAAIKEIDKIKKQEAFELALFVAQKMSEEESRCYWDLEPTKK